MMSKQKLTRRIAAGLAASALLTVSPVFAAESEFQLDQVTVTASRIEENVATTAKDVTVLSKKQIEEKGAKTLADALQGVPGVIVAGQGGPGSTAIPFILGTDRVLVLIDGKRMNLPQGSAVGKVGIDLNTLPISDNVEKIEIVRGGSSALYGADAVGGVINIITKKGAATTQTTIDSGFGSNHTYRHAFSTEGSDQSLSWHITGSRNSTDGQRVNSKAESDNVSVRLDQAINSNETITLNYDYYDSHAGLPGSLSRNNPTDYYDILRRTWGLDYSAKHDAGERKLRFYTIDQANTGVETDYSDNKIPFRHDNKVTAFEYQDSALVGKQHAITWGGEWRKEEVWSTGEGKVLRKGINTAAYVQDRFAWNEKTTLTTGMRYDHNSIYGDKWLPRMEVSYQQDETTNLFANWGKVFKAPTFDDLFFSDPGGYMISDPNLKPETGWTSEVGVKKRLSDVSEGTLSLFKRKLDVALDWQPTGDPDNDPWKMSNIPGLTATGVNAAFATKLSPETTLSFGYTYLDAHDANDQYTGEPRHSFTTGITNTSGKLTTAVSGTYVDASGHDYSRISSRFVANVGLKYAFTKEQSMFIHVNNLFDRKYQEMADYPALERTIFIGLKQTL